MLPKRQRLSKRAFAMILRKTKKKIFLPHLIILVGFLSEKQDPMRYGVLISSKMRQGSSVLLHKLRRELYDYIQNNLTTTDIANRKGLGMILIPQSSFFSTYKKMSAQEAVDTITDTLRAL